MSDKTRVIYVSPDNTYTVGTRDGDTVGRPRLNDEKAVTEFSRIGVEQGVELGEVTILESKVDGDVFYHLCVDGIPHIRFKSLSDLSVISKAFKAGVISLVHRRFLGGLGDLMALSGAVVFLSRIHDKLRLTGAERYRHEFKRIFSKYTNVELDSIIKDDSQYLNSDIPENLFLHNQRTSISDTRLDQFERTYRTFGIPYKYRWDLCPVSDACNEIEQLDVPNEPYIFVHDDPDRRFVIDRRRLPALRVYHPASVKNESILSFKNVIENADQVHLWDSSFFHLTECLSPKGSLYYHRYVRPFHKRHGDYKTRHKWEILT